MGSEGNAVLGRRPGERLYVGCGKPLWRAVLLRGIDGERYYNWGFGDI